MDTAEDVLPHPCLEEETLTPSVRHKRENLNAQFQYASAEAAIEPPESGDFHDAFLTAGGDVAVILGDVTGHGAEAAKKADLIRREATRQLQQGATPLETLSIVNDRMGEADNDYATVFVGSVSSETGELTYASAGHEPSLIAHNDPKEPDVEQLTTTGPPLGVLPSSAHPFSQGTATLDPGDTLLAYSDGLTEARRTTPEGVTDWFGVSRLKEFFARIFGRGPSYIVRKIIERVLSFSSSQLRDDLAILALRREAGHSPTAVHRDATVDGVGRSENAEIRRLRS